MTAENNIHKEEENIFSIPDYLKQLREKKGVSLEEAVNTLKISYDYIKVFEEGDFGSLPQDVYTRIFLRVYTEYLDGDVDKVMAGFAALTPGKNGAKTDQNSERKSKTRFDSKNWVKNVPINSNLIMVWTITILVIIIFWGLFCGRKQEEPVNETSFEEIFFEEKEVSEVDIKKVKPVKTKPVEVEPAVVKEEVTPQTPINEDLPAAEIKEKVKSKKIVLKAKALEDVSLEMIVDGKITIKEVMKKGEYRIWTANNKFIINTENAGALDFTFNDERFGVLGAIDEPKTGISFPPVKEEE